MLPTDFMRTALENSGNPIYELELLPIYVALFIWGGTVKSSHLVCYLDNDAARAAMCKGYGSTELAQRIVGCAMEAESPYKYPHTPISLMVQADWIAKRWSSWGRRESR